MAEQSKDLGSGSIGKLLFSLSVPAITAQIINALYNIVDRMYIGHMDGIGALALTGVGLSFPIIILISAFSALVGMGGAPRASIKMGEGDNAGAEKIMGNCFAALVIISVVLTLFFHAFMEPLLFLFGASTETIPYAMSYLRIYVTGTIFVQMAVGMNAFITSQGFAKVSMLTVLIGAILNIVLDPIFIFGLGLGVQGAAYATVISQGISALWVLQFLFGRKTKLRIRKENLRLDFKVLGPVLALGMAPFVMQSTESLVNIVLNSSLQRYGGDVAVGAMTIIGSVTQVAMMPMMGLSQGGQPIMGFNYGARKFDRVKKTFKLLLMSSLAYSVSMWLIIQLAPGLLVGLFSQDPALRDFTMQAIRIHMACIFMMGAQVACQQTFIAMGQAKISLFLAMLRKVILLIPLVYLFSSLFGLWGIFFATPVADLVATGSTCSIFAYRFPRLLRQGEQGEKLQ